MAYIQDGRVIPNVAAVENRGKSLRVSSAPRGMGHSAGMTSGVITAAQAAGSVFFLIRPNYFAGAYVTYIERIRLQYVTTVAYTTPITAGRRISIYRGAISSAGATSGGTGYTPAQKDLSQNVSQVSSANNGDLRIATNTGLTVSGVTWEATPFKEMTLTHLGTAGANQEEIFDFNPSASSPIAITGGQILGIRNPIAMDAGGTWIISIDIDWHEAYNYASTQSE